MKEEHKNTDGDFALVLYEFKCKTNQLRVKTVIEYDNTGGVLETNNHEDDTWQDVAPGTAGEVVISAHRFRRQLHVTVADTGVGLPPGFALDASERLGLQIVRTLATGELRGSIELRGRPDGGTEAVIVVPLTKR